MEREESSSRLDFILTSAGCAIDLSNVWQFPYITGEYGGAAFALVYLVFLLVLRPPITVMEFAAGKASQKNAALSFDLLESKGSRWYLTKYVAMTGDYILMMFHTIVGGWMMLYLFKAFKGDFGGMDAEAVAGEFVNTLASPALTGGFMVIAVLLRFEACATGLQKRVKRITKVMMVCLLALMVVLAVYSMALSGGGPGLESYLKLNFGKMVESGIGGAMFAVLGQSFFTLSVGIETLAIFGNYIDKERTLTGEVVSVTLLGILVVFMAGLIVFPACFACNIEARSGPSLIFITLLDVLNHMAGGRIWGVLFFLFTSFAAFSTIIAVLQNIISFTMDLTGCILKEAVLCNIATTILLSLPCVPGFNPWSGLVPLREKNTILDLEDFILNNDLLPIGSMLYLLFYTNRYGWGSERFVAGANEGKGTCFPVWTRTYVSHILSLIVLVIFIQRYASKFPES